MRHETQHFITGLTQPTKTADSEDNTEDLQVRWDFETGSTWDTEFSHEKTILHRFDHPGLYNVTLEVKDTGGLTDSASIEVMVDEPLCPFASIFGENDYRTVILRKFRDDILSKNKAGKKIICFYYSHSDMISGLLSNHPILKSFTEKIIDAMIPVIKSVMDKNLFY